MLSAAGIKHIRSLHRKKERQGEGLFLVEGAKNLTELLESQSYQIERLILSQDYYELFSNRFPGLLPLMVLASPTQIEQASTLESNSVGLAVVRTKETKLKYPSKNEWTLALDGIRDPGNMGTIIRTADWFGIEQIWASADCAEFYNPKTIMASMGSFCRVAVVPTDLPAALAEYKGHKIGTMLDGEALGQVHQTEITGGVVVIGSESHGISPAVAEQLSLKVRIAGFGHAESLNAGIATGIILHNLIKA